MEKYRDVSIYILNISDFHLYFAHFVSKNSKYYELLFHMYFPDFHTDMKWLQPSFQETCSRNWL